MELQHDGEPTEEKTVTTASSSLLLDLDSSSSFFRNRALLLDLDSSSSFFRNRALLLDLDSSYLASSFFRNRALLLDYLASSFFRNRVDYLAYLVAYYSSCLESLVESSFQSTDSYNGTARMQKMHLLKQYDFVKKELNWPDVISIAHNLHLDGYIKQHEMEQIKDGSQSRRKAIDTLLKTVLRNPSTVLAFMRILESKRRLLYIAERINKTKISAAEMERFHFQAGTRQHQSIYLEPSQKFHFSDSDVDFLIHNLFEEEEVIDQISDSLLSNFYISIGDHSKISDCAYLDNKILGLLDLMKKWPDNIHDIFIEVLTENNLQHVIDSLERNQMVNIKRKYSSCDDEISPAKKHMKIDHNQKVSGSDAVEKFASGLRISTAKQNLRKKAIKHLDLDFNEAFIGSLGLMLSFKVGEPSQKMKQPFA